MLQAITAATVNAARFILILIICYGLFIKIGAELMLQLWICTKMAHQRTKKVHCV
jgi:hypothetical protein